MFRITMEVDGKPVKAENFADELKRATYRAVEQGIADQAAELRCPVHGEATTVTIKGALLADNMTLAVTTCCDDFGQAVLDELGAQPDGDGTAEAASTVSARRTGEQDNG